MTVIKDVLIVAAVVLSGPCMAQAGGTTGSSVPADRATSQANPASQTPSSTEAPAAAESTRAAESTGATESTGPAESTELAAQAPLRWSLVAGWQRYREPAMRLIGPSAGLRVETVEGALEWGDAEAEVQMGLVNYASPISGRLNGIPSLHGSVALWWGSKPSGALPRLGLAAQTDWTDLRGTTDRGAEGYERLGVSLWVQGEWRLTSEADAKARAPRLVASALLLGRQRSWLSQVSALYPDITNRQRRGAMLRLEVPWSAEGRHGLVYAGYRYLDDSDRQPLPLGGYVYEPASRTIKLGVSVDL
jgi:hypothetical protein